MRLIAEVLVALVALEHLWFMILEMFLWTKPLGLRTFNQSFDRASDTAVLAANQGLYNGFLAAGLVFGLLYSDARAGLHIQMFFLICVIAAGVYGGYSVSRKILLVQATPALLALILLWLS